MRILIIKLSSLGDLFHALPTVHAVRNAYAGCQIEWVTHTTYKPLVECFPDVDRVIPYPRNDFRQQGKTFLREIRAQPYDLILDLQGLLKSAFVAQVAKGQRRIGPSFWREGSRLLYDAVAGPRNLNRHAVDQIWDVVEYLNIPHCQPMFPVAFPTQINTADTPHIILAPASRWPAKNWPADRFAATARQLQAQWNATISLIGAPGDEPLCATIEKALDGACLNQAGKTSLPQMGSMIAAADLLIANDSGPVHMAAAIGTPCVVLFGPTDPVRIGPYGADHQILLPNTPCICGRTRVCKHPETACIKEITVAAAVQAANHILAQRQAKRITSHPANEPPPVGPHGGHMPHPRG